MTRPQTGSRNRSCSHQTDGSQWFVRDLGGALGAHAADCTAVAAVPAPPAACSSGQPDALNLALDRLTLVRINSPVVLA